MKINNLKKLNVKNCLIKLLIVNLFILTFTSCGIDEILKDSPLPKRNFNYKGPLAYGKITPELIPELTNIELVDETFKIDDNLVNENFKKFIEEAENKAIPVKIPRKNWGTIAIYDDSISNVVESLTMEKFKLTFKLKNSYPIPIVGGEGATEIIFVEEGTNDTIFSHPIREDTIGKNEVYDFTIDLSNKTISNQTNIFIHNFTTDSTQKIKINGKETFTFNLKLEVAKFKSVRVFTDQSFTVNETIDFNVDTLQTVDQDKTKGNVSFFITNNLPANANMQFYFINNNDNITDSLFNKGRFFFEGVEVNDKGVALKESLNQEKKEVIIFDSTKINRITDAKKMKVSISVNTRGTRYPGKEQNYINKPGIGNSVKAGQKSFIDFQISGDIITKVGQN